MLPGTHEHFDKFAGKNHICKTGHSQINNNYVPFTTSAVCAAPWAHGNESLVSYEVRKRKTQSAHPMQISPDMRTAQKKMKLHEMQPSEEFSHHGV